MNREEEILGEMEMLQSELYYRRGVKTDWEWLNENRQSLFERYAKGDNAAIAFFKKEVIDVGIFTDRGLPSDGVGVKWDLNFQWGLYVDPNVSHAYRTINIMDLLRRKTDSPSKILKGYKSSVSVIRHGKPSIEMPEWVDKD